MTTRARRERRGPQIDQLDCAIIARLQDDGRQSHRELARQLAVPEATVRYRIHRLIKARLVTVTAVIDPGVLGHTVKVVIRLRVEPPHLTAATESLAGLPEVSWLAITTGADDLVLRAAFADQEALAQFLTSQLAPLPSLVQRQTTLALRTIKHEDTWARWLSLLPMAGGRAAAG